MPSDKINTAVLSFFESSESIPPRIKPLTTLDEVKEGTVLFLPDLETKSFQVVEIGKIAKRKDGLQITGGDFHEGLYDSSLNRYPRHLWYTAYPSGGEQEIFQITPSQIQQRQVYEI